MRRGAGWAGAAGRWLLLRLRAGAAESCCRSAAELLPSRPHSWATVDLLILQAAVVPAALQQQLLSITALACRSCCVARCLACKGAAAARPLALSCPRTWVPRSLKMMTEPSLRPRLSIVALSLSTSPLLAPALGGSVRRWRAG